MTNRLIGLNLGVLGLLIALLGLVYWLNTGDRAVPGLIEDLQSGDLQAQMLAAEGLKKIGSNARSTVSALVTVATSDSNLFLSVGLRLPPIYVSHRDPDQLCCRTAAGVRPRS